MRIITLLGIKIREYQRKVQLRFKSDTIPITSIDKMKLSTSILVVVGLFIGVNSDQISYENYRIYSVQTKNDDQLRLLQAFEANQTDFIFLTDPSIHADTDIVVSPQNVQYIETTFTKYGLNFKIKTDNLQR